ncbi:hypothetical protein BD309DRAFT_737502 [Dichomitus squalens]|uniref:Uncharacterized protein n=1 Tax=Dichomitus squalens TaxID=114155 RepID=A0A4Q9PSW3_9APHY|nr:hypothetical protein BD309DRAFT_737502 [Dichomitus squalens]TBU57547.1 hypothetical protein BD310DRAFT_550074 [Dichomitus squalens]
MDTSPHTQDSLPLPRIHFLHPGFTSFTQDSFPLSRIHFLYAGFISVNPGFVPLTQDSLPHTPHMCPYTLGSALPLTPGLARYRFTPSSID